jgi:N-acetylglutamate synthase-like GNAT family acetyltransferase
MADLDSACEGISTRIEEMDWNDDARIAVQEFCEKAGLPPSATPWGKVLKIFVLRGADGRIEATARIEMIYGRPFVESVAVRSDLRGKGLGRLIVNHAVSRAHELGFHSVWAIARIPEFYRKLGFVEERDRELIARQRNDCLKCDQYGRECFPLLMRKDVG